jgi:hypothetical protein
MGFYPFASTGVAARPVYTAAPGSGLYVQAMINVSTNAALVNGVLRLVPWYVWKAVTIQGLGGEYTAAGDAASTLHVAIYSDNGNGYPGALFLDGGSFNTGGTPGVELNAVTQITVPAGLYWTGGVVQNVATTQPTIRVGQFMNDFSAAGNTLPAAGATAVGYSQGGVTAALPGTFTPISTNVVGAAPRLLIQLV